MALPIDLYTMDYVQDGLPFCEQPLRADINLQTLDLVGDGLPFAANATIQTAPSSVLTLDRAYAGLPFSWYGGGLDLPTLDYVGEGVPFVSNITGGDTTFYAGTNTIVITAPQATVAGLSRKFPNVRDEMVFSLQEPAHSFPYISVQIP